MKSNSLTILDRLNEILESIELIDEWSRFATNESDFMMSPHGVMAFNACVYSNIDEDIVFSVIKEHLQPLKETIERIIIKLRNS